MSPPLDIQAISPSTPTLPVGPGNGQLTPQNLHPTTLPEPPPDKPRSATAHTPEPVKQNNTVELGFSVDHESNALKIKVTNQVSGEVVREFEIKGLGNAHHEPVTHKGVIVDDRT